MVVLEIQATNILSKYASEEMPEPVKRLYDAIDVAIEALKKQIPKKPICCEHSFEAYRCPKCSKCVGVYDLEHIKVIKARFCSECGQAVDWEE